MGHIVSHGVNIEAKKIKVMMDWMIPKTMKKIRGFLCLTRYYRKFFRNYGRKVAPLTSLSKKDGSWCM